MLHALLLTVAAAVRVANAQGPQALDPSEVQVDNGILVGASIHLYAPVHIRLLTANNIGILAIYEEIQ